MTENKFKLFKRKLLRYFRDGDYQRCLILLINHFEDEDSEDAQNVDHWLTWLNTIEKRIQELQEEKNSIEDHQMEKWKIENNSLWIQRNRIFKSIRDMLSKIQPVQFLDFKQRRYVPVFSRDKPHPRSISPRRETPNPPSPSASANS